MKRISGTLRMGTVLATCLRTYLQHPGHLRLTALLAFTMP